MIPLSKEGFGAKAVWQEKDPFTSWLTMFAQIL
jgi:hypothetical protein